MTRRWREMDSNLNAIAGDVLGPDPSGSSSIGALPADDLSFRRCRAGALQCRDRRPRLRCRREAVACVKGRFFDRAHEKLTQLAKFATNELVPVDMRDVSALLAAEVRSDG